LEIFFSAIQKCFVSETFGTETVLKSLAGFYHEKKQKFTSEIFFYSDPFTSFAPSQTWPVQQDHYNFDQNQHQHVNQMWQPDQAVDQHQQQQVWQSDQAVDQHQQQQVWQQHHQVDDRQERIADLERQVAELKASLENSDQTRQALENELLPEKERLIKNLENQLLYLQTSFESSDLARQSLEHEMSQLPTW